MNRYERALAAGAKRPFDLIQGWRFVGGMDLADEKQLASEFVRSPDDVVVTRGVCWSSEPDYSVSMRAVWLQDGKLFEMEAAHCSCNGYEDSWDPKEVNKAYILNLIETKKDKNGWTYGALECKEYIDGLLWVIGDTDE